MVLEAIESGGGGAKLISNLDKQQKNQDYGYVYIKRIKKNPDILKMLHF